MAIVFPIHPRLSLAGLPTVAYNHRIESQREHEATMTHIAFEVVDVFTTSRFGGNPLAVILDARGLADAPVG